MDKTTKVLLLLIATALWANVLLKIPISRTVKADTPTHCTGKFTVNAWGADVKNIGGYDLDLTCSE